MARIACRFQAVTGDSGEYGLAEHIMGINTERDLEANLQIGPTDQGMVRLYIYAGELEIPMDFEPEEAEEIAEEILAAAKAAAAMAKS